MSVGFHYPLEGYIKTLKQIVNKDGMMIFGVRKWVYESASFLPDFEYVQFYTILVISMKVFGILVICLIILDVIMSLL